MELPPKKSKNDNTLQSEASGNSDFHVQNRTRHIAKLSN